MGGNVKRILFSVAVLILAIGWFASSQITQIPNNPFNPGAAGVYNLGPGAGISLKGAAIAFGNGTAGDASGITEAGAYYYTSGLASLNFNILVGNDACIAAVAGAYRACFDSSGVRTGSTLMYGFSSGTAGAAANDTGIERISAGVIGLNNGTSGAGGGLQIPAQKSTTGQRFACFTTTGLIVSSASACSGT